MAVELSAQGVIQGGEDEWQHKRCEDDVWRQDDEVDGSSPILQRIWHRADVGVVDDVGPEKQSRRHNRGDHGSLMQSAMALADTGKADN